MNLQILVTNAILVVSLVLNRPVKGQVSQCTKAILPIDGYVLSLQWPIEFCYRVRRCSLRRPLHQWIIHGLWPQFNATKSITSIRLTGSPFPQYCCHSHEPDDLSDFEPKLGEEMTQFWPSLKSSGRSTMTESFKFWRHQWNKHGTCARNASHHSEYSMQDYFQITIELYRQFPIDRMLRSSGIVPSNDKAYDRTQFDKALQSNKFQANIFQLKCSIKDGPIGILSEIQICLDRQLNPINCKYLFELELESTETTDNIGCGNRIVLLEY